MKKTLSNTWAVLDGKERKQFVSLVALDIFISIADILSLALLLWIIQFYIQPGDQPGPSFLPGWLSDRDSVWIIALFFLAFGMKNIIAWFVARAWYKFTAGVAVRISRLNLRNYQRSGFGEFINTDSSIHIRKIGFQPFEFAQYILSGIPQIITQLTLILLTIIAILIFNAKLFLLLLLILLPPVITIFYFIRNRLSHSRNLIKTGNETSFQHLLDALKGYVESNIYGRNSFFLNRFTSSRKKFSKALFDSISVQALPPRVIEIFAVLGLFLLISIAKWTGTNNTDHLVTIGAFLGAAYKIIPGVVRIINISGQIKAYEFAVNDLYPIDRAKESIKDKDAPGEIYSLSLKNINFSYDHQQVLHNFSMSVDKGDFLVITGDSGKGKTTILNLLLGFLDAEKGQILFNDKPVSKEIIRHYWSQIAYVKQQSFLIHDTVLRNITLEEDIYNRERLEFALDVSGINKLVESWPEGLDKMITENGKNISGGQRQRIAIARALYKNAGLIILDEPFNELDEESECALLRSFGLLSQAGKIIILVTHNQQSLSYSTKKLSLDEQ